MISTRNLFRPIYKLLHELERFPVNGLENFSLYSQEIQLLDTRTNLHAMGLFQYQCVSKSCHLLLKWRYTEVDITVLRAEFEKPDDLNVRLLLEAFDGTDKLEEEFLFIYKYNNKGLIEKHIIQDRIRIKKPPVLCLK